MTPSPPASTFMDNVDQKNCLHPDGLQSSSLPHASQSERSIAFKRWARGRCYRCLARDHQVRYCRNSFRCIRCRRPGHREQHCHLRSNSSIPWVNSSEVQPHHHERMKSWADVVAMPSPSVCDPTLSSSTVTQSTVASLSESLRSELRQLILDCVEEVLRPLREETNTIKLWLARLANHSEFAEPHGEHISFSNMPELFAPCSPVHRSPTPSILTSLIFACTPSDSLGPEKTHVNTTNLVTDGLELVVDAEIRQKMPAEQASVMSSTIVSLVEACTPVDSLVCEEKMSTEQASVTSSIIVSLVEACTPVDCMVCEEACMISEDSINGDMTADKVVGTPSTTSLLQTVNPDEDFVLVEDASDDEEDISQVTVEDPIFLITIEDNPMHSTTDVKAEVNTIEDNHLHSTTEVNEVEDPSTNVASSVAIAMENDPTCPPTLPPSPSATLARRRHKSYDRSSLRRSGRIAQRNVLKDLGIIGKDGKLNESAMQDIVDCLKELLPPDLLNPVMSLKGRAFWDFVAEASRHLRRP